MSHSDDVLEFVRKWIAVEVAAEQERCAKVVEEYARQCQEVADDSDMQMFYHEVAAGNQYAATILCEAATAIRARAGKAEIDNPPVV